MKKNITKNKTDMKAIRLLITTLLCTAMPVAMSAQENLKKAIDNFVNSKDLGGHMQTSNYLENTGTEHKVSSFYDQYIFELPMSKKKELNPVLDAFNKDKSTAYNVYSRDAGISDDAFTTIAYGGKLDKTVAFGTHKERNYRVMLVQDRQDSLRRYCYGIVWYEDKKNDKFCGSINIVYGLNPQKTKKKTTTYYGDFSTLESLGGLEQLKELDKLKDLGKLSELGNGTYVIMNSDTSDSIQIKTSSDFLKRFGTLRSTFMKSRSYRQIDIRAVLANKIQELCRTNGKLLNSDERQLCINSLKEMQKNESDSYVKGILDLAQSSLKK